jgi:hypothetical protein
MIATHGECGAEWQQSGNKTGHCSGCHRTFSGISTFDAHQRIVDGRNVCLDPAELIDKNGRPRFRTFTDKAGCEVWRSAKERPKNSWGV